MTYTVTVTKTAINLTNGSDINATAAGAFSYAKENETVRLSSFAGDDIIIDFNGGDTATVNGGGSLSTADTFIAALDAVVTA